MRVPSLNLLKRVTCHHCWSTFTPEDVLWISAHSDLLGDPRLGAEQQQRFLPTRFDMDGNAIDARGFSCQHLACPKCHLPLPRALLEAEPAFVSILGTPACGKSFFLAALTWELRRQLPQQFAVSFSDADPITNRNLNEYEESLFLNPTPDDLVLLGNLIRKTEEQGDLYDTVMYGGQTVSYPRPFLFALRPLQHHPHYDMANRVARVLCLYDNAGEHFQPGKGDSTSSPVTRHLAKSRLLLFLFDPTQDPRFRQVLNSGDHSAGTPNARRTSRQETVLMEAAVRVRRTLGLPQNVKHDQPLVVVLTKADAWADQLHLGNWSQPWVAKANVSALDTHQIEANSTELRGLLLRICPEIVQAAEDFARDVIYLPVSALGHKPAADPQTGRLAIQPGDIHPQGVAMPLLYGMVRCMPGLIPSVKRAHRGGSHDGNMPAQPWYS